jgi:uncharacterized protein YceH (UPF0502 family)
MTEPSTSGPPLDDVGVRILGSLIEKQFVTPDNYPLTLNSLTAACNQSSNREPVMDLDEETVKRTLAELGRRSLVRPVHRGDSRALRYRQELGEKLHLHAPELAALCVLMVRGPQTPGEIRTRAARMFEFTEPRHVEVTLETMMGLSPPLVAQLPRQRGQKEARWTHLFAGEPRVDPREADESHTHQEASPAASPSTTLFRSPGAAERIDALEQEVSALRKEVADLRGQLDAFRRQFE